MRVWQGGCAGQHGHTHLLRLHGDPPNHRPGVHPPAAEHPLHCASTVGRDVILAGHLFRLRGPCASTPPPPPPVHAARQSTGIKRRHRSQLLRRLCCWRETATAPRVSDGRRSADSNSLVRPCPHKYGHEFFSTPWIRPVPPCRRGTHRLVGSTRSLRTGTRQTLLLMT